VGAIKTIKQVILDRLRECIAAAQDQYGAAVLPIYGSNSKGAPFQIGSCVLLRLDGESFLVTAAHVIDWHERASLYVGQSQLEPIALDFIVTNRVAGSRDRDKADVAIAKLPADFVAKLGGAKFITKSELSYADVKTKGQAFTCLGFPNSKNKKVDRNKTIITAQMASVTGLRILPNDLVRELRVSGDQHVFVKHNKYSKDLVGTKVNSFSLPGMSGGAVIDLGNVADPKNLTSKCNPRLAGILIEFHSKHEAIVGTRLAFILKELIR
jgi:hypothetical protein